MKYQKVLDKILGQKTKVKILRYMIGSHNEQSGRQIAQESGVNHEQCHRVLQEFYREGLLNMRRAGNAYLFNLRKDHYLIKKAIIPLFQTESRLLQTLIEEIKHIKNAKISSLVLFGSIAKGKGQSHSDIDVLVVVRNKVNKEKISDEIRRRNDYFLSRYGNALSPYVVSEEEFRRRYKKGDKLIKEIVRCGKVVSGKTPGELITK